jgi:transmembrane sensor
VTMPRFPLAGMQEKSVDHETIHRLWLGIVARRTERRKVRARWDLALAFSAGLSAAVLLLILTGTLPWQRAPSVVEPTQGALLLRGNVDWSTVDVPRAMPETLEFSDGSRILLDPTARVAPLENTARSMALLLKTGRAVFDVHPGGPRRWSIEAGLATIEVIGTRFAISRTADALTVEVEHGTVLVRGERVVDRVQRLASSRKQARRRGASSRSAGPMPKRTKTSARPA